MMSNALYLSNNNSYFISPISNGTFGSKAKQLKQTDASVNEISETVTLTFGVKQIKITQSNGAMTLETTYRRKAYIIG